MSSASSQQGLNAPISAVEATLRREAESLDLFDAGAWLGCTPLFPLMETGTPQLLEAVHRHAHIKGALVSHWAGTPDCSQESNQLLLRQIQDHDTWYATLTLNPLFPQDTGSPGSPDWVWPERVRAVRVFPATFGFALRDWCVGALCDLLIERCLPLFVFHTETTFEDIHHIACAYPALRIVLETQPKKVLYHARMLLPLLKACPNVHLDLSNTCSQGLVEYTVNALGADRLIFSTFAPANDPLVPLGLLLQADITQEDKQAIAGGTIRRIISEVRT